MKEETANILAAASQNPIVAKSTAGLTLGTGLASWLSWIPEWAADPAIWATIMGAALSFVLIITNTKAMFDRSRESRREERRRKEQHDIDMAIKSLERKKLERDLNQGDSHGN